VYKVELLTPKVMLRGHVTTWPLVVSDPVIEGDEIYELTVDGTVFYEMIFEKNQ
jgi:hypothetical protein